MMDHISHVSQQVEIEEFNLREKANLRFDKSTNIDDVLHHIGNISTNTKSMESLAADVSTSAKWYQQQALLQLPTLKILSQCQLKRASPNLLNYPLKTGSFQIMSLGNDRVLTVKRSDIVSENVDVIVNAADEQLEQTGSVAEH